ncbi:class I mannose-6-phosphate isomerase [Parabacteroides sp. Marseille-P3160]|uniref:class I mannose-6-phosphate isomerase n=1 Tax=Parabacteroides sp. Marseille-P3160 TaxID=1917887 RepID=UPI0009BACB9F|nr:class I mannose-6-phosphate isomerase [Parabacteroides sp. Marseille-P3160]
MRKYNYEKFPAKDVDGYVEKGWDNIIKKLRNITTNNSILAIDMYVGVNEDEVKSEIKKLNPSILINTRDLFKSESDLTKMTFRFMTDDPLFGYMTNLTMADYFDYSKLEEAKRNIQNCEGIVIVIGNGASMVVPQNACIIYADMTRWEIQLRFHKNKIKALGVDDRGEAFSIKYKRGYFNDWPICDAYKETLFHRISFWLDTHIPDEPKMIDKATFFNGIETTIKQPFRVVPFFAPAPWGGQWMKDVCDLNRDEVNYGWCFDCVPEENSLLFNINGTLFEIPSINLVLLKSRELLGEPVESRFGKEFPIRFDMLDTVQGGCLSFQVHPTTQFIRKNFGMQYTQDESYYMIDAYENASVFLGLKNSINKEEMISDLRKSGKGEIRFDAEKYVNRLPVKKHDHFLIPGGTVHCSGSQCLVLEISSTPNLFTFKMWDWERLGLDGKPRPLNIERGLQVIQWERDTDYTMKNLVNVCTFLGEGDGWIEEKTGLHPNEFIETRRHKFTKKVTHHTNNSVNVLNLVEGEEIIVESPNNYFEPFIVHYAETFIIPASLDNYTITPYGKSKDKECITIKAYVRF